MQEIVSTINGYIWSSQLIYLCLGAGLFFSILTRFAQVLRKCGISAKCCA
jgi:AGCS family alanine or glycine:cation symporter